LHRELGTWHGANHKNVLPLLGYCTTFGSVPCFVSPWMRYGTVLEFLVARPWANRVKLVSLIHICVRVLMHCPAGRHRRRLVFSAQCSDSSRRYSWCQYHSHIKPFPLFDLMKHNQVNILVSADKVPCISDFGLSYLVGDMLPSTKPHGSLRWKAPERHQPEFFRLSNQEAQGVPSDVWSFGMTILVSLINILL
jgi:serine/threonine protein kinase